LKIGFAINQNSVRYSSSIKKKIKDLTTMKVVMDPGSKPDILRITGEAQHTLKSSCITGILEDEAAYIVLSVKRFIDATGDLVL